MASFVIGVAGGSGSGKTTVVRRIVDSLGPEHVTLLDHDRYYRDRNDLRLEERAALNYDHPDSLETDLMVQHMRRLKAGQAVEAPRYDFTRHARLTEKDTVQPRRALIVEGILILTDAALRDVAAARDAAASAGRVGIVGYCWGGFITWMSASRLPESTRMSPWRMISSGVGVMSSFWRRIRWT